MPQGFQAFDSSGAIQTDITERLCRVLGITTISAGVSGSVTNAAFAQGDPFWIARLSTASLSYGPLFSFNSGTNTLSWTWPVSGAAHILIYGVY